MTRSADPADFAVPSSISDVAREQLAITVGLEMAAQDSPTDIAGWEAMISFADEMLGAMIPAPAEGARITPTPLGGVSAYDVRPQDPPSGRTCLYLHGGALIIGAGEVGAAMTAAFADGAGMRSIGVDYRMPPAHRGRHLGRRQPRRRARAPRPRRRPADAGSAGPAHARGRPHRVGRFVRHHARRRPGAASPPGAGDRALRRRPRPRAPGVPAELHVFEAMPHGGFGSILEGGLGSVPEDREGVRGAAAVPGGVVRCVVT